MLGDDVGGFEVGISISTHGSVPLHVRFRLYGYGLFGLIFVSEHAAGPIQLILQSPLDGQ